MKYDFDLLIKRTNRKKTLSIIIRDQKVILSAPKYVSDQEIDKILKSKFAWIQKKLTIEKKNLKLNKKYYTSGEIFLYLGKEYYLDIKKSTKSDIYISHNKLIIETTNFDNNNFVKNQNKLNKWILNRTPMGRWGKPDEVSNVIEFLISEKSSYITGSTIYVDGGWNIS